MIESKKARSTSDQLRIMKEQIIQKYISRNISCKEGSLLLSLHEKSFCRLVAQYKRYGSSCLVPKKPWPKTGSPDNRSPSWIEDIVCDLALSNPHLRPIALTNLLLSSHNVSLHQTTVWRILKRKKVRYTETYKRWKDDPKLYAYDEPWAELQLDASFPFGRRTTGDNRGLVSFDAIDDCSRFVMAWLYEDNTIENAIDFVKRVIRKFPWRIRAIRTDNQFDTTPFRNFLEACGIRLIVNPPYTPEHNGKIERFHKTMKREFYWRYIKPTDDFEYIQYQFQLWLYHYNYERKHSWLKMFGRTPAQKLVSSYLESFQTLIPIIQDDLFHTSQVDFVKVTWILQQYNFCLISQFLLWW